MKMWGDTGLPGLVFASFQTLGKPFKDLRLEMLCKNGLTRVLSAAEDDVRYHCFCDYLGLLGGAHAVQRLRRPADPVAPRLVAAYCLESLGCH